MRKGKRNGSRRRPRAGRNGAKALATATALAGGTHAYADAIRFDNKDGEFEWSRCLERVWLDVTMPAGAQDGQRNPSSFEQYRPCEKGCHPCITLNAASGNWIMDEYNWCYKELLPWGSGWWIKERLPNDAGWTSDGFAEITDDSYCDYWEFYHFAYAGIRFRADDGVHYGWIKSRLWNQNEPYLPALAWGYETEPDKPIRAGAGVPPHCTGNESLRLKCKPARKGSRIKATVKEATPGLFVTFRLDGDPNNDQERVVNRLGKARAKFRRVGPGQHTVEVRECELRGNATCEP